MFQKLDHFLFSLTTKKSNRIIIIKKKKWKISRVKEGIRSKIITKFKVLKTKKGKEMAIMKNTSAIRLTIIAFTAALTANILVYQKLIGEKEHKPTPSQPIKSCRKLSEVTKNNVKNPDKDK